MGQPRLRPREGGASTMKRPACPNVELRFKVGLAPPAAFDNALWLLLDPKFGLMDPKLPRPCVGVPGLDPRPLRPCVGVPGFSPRRAPYSDANGTEVGWPLSKRCGVDFVPGRGDRPAPGSPVADRAEVGREFDAPGLLGGIKSLPPPSRGAGEGDRTCARTASSSLCTFSAADAPPPPEATWNSSKKPKRFNSSSGLSQTCRSNAPSCAKCANACFPCSFFRNFFISCLRFSSLAAASAKSRSRSLCSSISLIIRFCASTSGSSSTK
mmetsp:Transcript_6004/g.9007  ORF Transcript_6004/g.9007 Transcript_6004/m.9007 type:complete len:268 (+) Transcript_6004:101-904(+)